MSTKIVVNIAAGDGLLPGYTKPLSHPKLVNKRQALVLLTWWQFQNYWFDIIAPSHLG